MMKLPKTQTTNFLIRHIMTATFHFSISIFSSTVPLHQIRYTFIITNICNQLNVTIMNDIPGVILRILSLCYLPLGDNSSWYRTRSAGILLGDSGAVATSSSHRHGDVHVAAVHNGVWIPDPSAHVVEVRTKDPSVPQNKTVQRPSSDEV